MCPYFELFNLLTYIKVRLASCLDSPGTYVKCNTLELKMFKAI